MKEAIVGVNGYKLPSCLSGRDRCQYVKEAIVGVNGYKLLSCLSGRDRC